MSNPTPDPSSVDPLNSIRQLNELEEQLASVRRRQRFFGVLLVLWMAGAAASVWIAYPVLRQHQISLSELPGLATGLRTLDGALKAQDSKIADDAADQKDSSARVDTLGRNLRSSIESARKAASDATSAWIHRIEVQLGGEIDGVKTQLAAAESARESDHARLAALQTELAEVRGDIARQTTELSAELETVRTQAANERARSNASTETVLAGLRQSQDRNRREVDTLAEKLALERVPFEAAKFRDTELAPGVTLYVNKVDVPLHRVSGWIWMLPDRRTIWLRGEGAQQPVEFYSTADGKKRELVITGVSKDAVVGYLLVPSGAGKTQVARTASSD
jgi:hypothetical protein